MKRTSATVTMDGAGRPLGMLPVHAGGFAGQLPFDLTRAGLGAGIRPGIGGDLFGDQTNLVKTGLAAGIHHGIQRLLVGLMGGTDLHDRLIILLEGFFRDLLQRGEGNG